MVTCLVVFYGCVFFDDLFARIDFFWMLVCLGDVGCVCFYAVDCYVCLIYICLITCFLYGVCFVDLFGYWFGVCCLRV